jgi:hypothetical protein
VVTTPEEVEEAEGMASNYTGLISVPVNDPVGPSVLPAFQVNVVGIALVNKLIEYSEAFIYPAVPSNIAILPDVRSPV